MELHPSRELVASGQKAGRGRRAQAHVRIWSTDTLQTLHVFGMAEFEAGVSAVAFSQLNGGSYVLAVDAGRESILSVWQWQWGHLLGKVAPSRTHVTALQFEQDGDVVTADSDGFITIYSVDSDGAYFVRMEFEAHIKGISSLVMLSEGTLISGGEKDRKIAAWDSLQNYKRITETKLPESAGGVRTIYPQRPGRNDGNLYVGTTRNNIMEGSLQRRFNQVLFGHHKQLMGLAVHPDDEMFATAGHDKNIALWKGHKLVFATQVGYECVSLAWHPSGGALAAGSTEGDIKALSPEKSPIAMKDVKWSTFNSTVGFLVSGMWNNRFYPMTSLISTASRSAAHDLLVSGDTDGYLRLFRYPCASPKAEYNETKVYSGAVYCARFLFNDRCMVSTGGGEAALMLWELVED
ncbi:unnamed protein product [Diatraea saccharalis]|uniref:Uncharacterized protein n=1 Tax=Diatraea saccharalis TaxID=40085 RepID=A0A9N9QUF3_9NEOP|nr:unnamed protein product [Diatraea saccharalis]